MEYIEEARAKINLTLKVLGRLENGYHALHSLVAFTDIIDRVLFTPGPTCRISVSGPYAKDLKGQNLLEKVLSLVQEQYPDLVLGQVLLEKNLPVASGIGGGSADAAALLQALKKANYNISFRVNWSELADHIGADVRVCMQNHATWMSGVGNTLHPLDRPLPPLPILLVNPMCVVPQDKTTRVFRLWKPEAYNEKESLRALSSPRILNKKDLLSIIKQNGNDLLSPASSLFPEISRVLHALQGCDGLEASSLSGAGPTCFGIFQNFQKMQEAQQKIWNLYPTWWVKAGTLI